MTDRQDWFSIDNYDKFKEVELVDLGLPSGTLWSKCNIGAKSELETGLFFQFGDITGHKEYTNASQTLWDYCWMSAPFNDYNEYYNGDDFSLHIHKCFDKIPSDCLNKDVYTLKKEYDCAYHHTNGVLRMPTIDDMHELLKNTNPKTIDNYQNTGVSGVLFTSVHNNKTMFIAQTYFCKNKNILKTSQVINLWSSSLRSKDCAFGFSFTNNFRCIGLPVRGVLRTE